MANGPPEIVLLPGLDGTGDLFDRVEAKLAPELSVKVIRYPHDPTLGYAGYVERVRNEIGSRTSTSWANHFRDRLRFLLPLSLADK